MKYLIFTIAALGVIPFSFLLSQNKYWIKNAFFGMIIAMCLYIRTSINFFSHESYRGSARGMEISLLHLMAFSIIGALLFANQFKRWLPNWGYRLYIIYFLLCLPSLSSAENLLISWFEIWKMIMLYFLYVAVYNFLRMSDDLKTVISYLALFTIINMLVIVWNHVHGVYQPHGVFPHQNSMAMGMHLFGPIFFASYVTNGFSSKIYKLFSVAFICAAAATARSYSRMALALMPIGYGISFLLCIFKQRPRNWIIRVLPIGLAGMVGLALMLPRIIERFEKAPEASGTTRVELALCAWEMIKDKPWQGVGINNWGIKINPPYEYAERADRKTGRGEDFADGIVETVYLLVCAECGIPALLAMIAWFAWHYIKCISLMKRLENTEWFFIPAGLVGGFTIIAIQSCFEWVYRQQLNLICLMFMFAIISYLADSPMAQKQATASKTIKDERPALNHTA
ncbi:MAG: O-antigen ligase family protein [Victivallales bacterium]|nr:O-antigen ligase family protein [Victivallales bacterium]